MTRIQTEDHIFTVDIEKTIGYYETHSLCECDYCRNYYAQIKGKFPQLEEFLSQFGVDISKPDEICMSFEMDNEIHYISIDYTVCGKIENMGQNEIYIHDNPLFRLGITDGFSSPNEQISDYFTISLNNEFTLPWVLDKPIPKMVTVTRKERIKNFFHKLFKA